MPLLRTGCECRPTRNDPCVPRRSGIGSKRKLQARRGRREKGKEETHMPTYIALLNFTEQGIKTVKDTVQRADSAAELAQKHGGSLQLYWTVGPYDVVAILEAPDYESATAFFLEVGSRG